MSSYSPAAASRRAGRIRRAACSSVQSPVGIGRTIVALDEWLTSAARARPDHPAVVADGRTLTYAELDAAAARCARGWRRWAWRAGERVATTLAPGLAFCELLHALPRLGAALVPLDPRRAGGAARACVSCSRPPDGAARRRWSSASAWIPRRCTRVIRSSGTTGTPKPVELTYANHRGQRAGVRRRARRGARTTAGCARCRSTTWAVWEC